MSSGVPEALESPKEVPGGLRSNLAGALYVVSINRMEEPLEEEGEETRRSRDDTVESDNYRCNSLMECD